MDKINHILEKIESGDYQIEHDKNCGCTFSWEINRSGELIDNVDGNECWQGMVLYVVGIDEPIAQTIQYEHCEVLAEGLDEDDIPDEIWDAMKIDGDETNPAHENSRRDSLIDWLLNSDYILDRDDDRGFANEYTMILRDPAEDDESTLSAEEWADCFLYDGDSATVAYTSFRHEEALQIEPDED